MDVEDIERVGDSAGANLDANPWPESQRLMLVRAGFALLSDVEQTVLRATMAWWQSTAPTLQHSRQGVTALTETTSSPVPQTLRMARKTRPLPS